MLGDEVPDILQRLRVFGSLLPGLRTVLNETTFPHESCGFVLVHAAARPALIAVIL
jgi:hypothetical protein